MTMISSAKSFFSLILFCIFTINRTCAVCSNSFVDKFNSLEAHWVEQSPQATNCVIQSGYLTSRSPPPDGECVLKYDGEYDALGFEIGVTALSSAVEYSMFIGVPAEETDVVSSDVAVQFWLSADAGELVLSIGSSPEEIFNLPYSGSQLKTTYTMTAAFTPEGNITFSLTDFGNALKDWSVDAGAYPGDAEQLGTKMAVLIQPPESTATGDLDNFRLVCPPGEGDDGEEDSDEDSDDLPDDKEDEDDDDSCSRGFFRMGCNKE